jgi:uncharacterized membrane protein YfcA
VDGVAKIAVGFVSGVLSGAFGIGGGLITTPAIRLLLGYPALIAVGTPLPVILPGALTGAVTYWRRGSADVRAGIVMGLVGSVGSVGGALLSQVAGGSVVLIATAAMIGWASADMLLQHRTAVRAEAVFGEGESDGALAPVLEGPNPGRRVLRLTLIGALAGFYSGFLGLGGGFVIVPALTRYAHSLLGHVDWPLALMLALGVVPGAVIGARLTEGASDRAVRLAFAILLAVVGVWLAATEIAGLHL